MVEVHGAVSVVMACVEEGQAATNEVKAHMCPLDCLTQIGLPQCHIIFNCYVLTIATGLPEYNGYAVDFIEAVAEVELKMPET